MTKDICRITDPNGTQHLTHIRKETQEILDTLGGACCLLRKNYGIHVIYQLRAYLFGDSGAVLAKSFTDLFEFLPVVKPGLYAEPVFTAHMLILVHMVLLFWSEQQVETNVAIIDFSEGLSSSHPEIYNRPVITEQAVKRFFDESLVFTGL